MGKMIVIDGLDGSGKATQAEILKNYLYYRDSLDLPQEEHALFISSQKKRMSVRSIEYLVKKYAKIACRSYLCN